MDRSPSVITVMSSREIQRAITRIAHEIAERNEEDESVILVGIQKGGVHLANRLAQQLQSIWKHPVPSGTLDVSMHRDDLDQRMTPEVHPTSIPGDITGKIIVLVDDVLFSGRTTRSALDALNHCGRPCRIQLAVLVDRGHRELPIRADFVGKNLATTPRQRVNVDLLEEGGNDIVQVEDLRP